MHALCDLDAFVEKSTFWMKTCNCLNEIQELKIRNILRVFFSFGSFSIAQTVSWSKSTCSYTIYRIQHAHAVLHINLQFLPSVSVLFNCAHLDSCKMFFTECGRAHERSNHSSCLIFERRQKSDMCWLFRYFLNFISSFGEILFDFSEKSNGTTVDPNNWRNALGTPTDRSTHRLINRMMSSHNLYTRYSSRNVNLYLDIFCWFFSSTSVADRIYTVYQILDSLISRRTPNSIRTVFCH